MHRLRTLVLDDHPTFRKSLRNLISRYDFIQVTNEADSAEEALKVVEKRPPHLAIVDIHLKGMNGFDFARIMKERFPQTQVVFITLYDNSSNMSEAARLGFPYVPKESLLEKLPLVLEEVKKKVEAILREYDK
ncbi:MAG: response regulator transcription factor [Candidatus Aureabacteria bacterium]|nr:response regulator transcription factor [Candidatus Auribacterota bacterium]